MAFRRKIESEGSEPEDGWGDDAQSTPVLTMPFLAHDDVADSTGLSNDTYEGGQSVVVEDDAGDDAEDTISLAEFLSVDDDTPPSPPLPSPDVESVDVGPVDVEPVAHDEPVVSTADLAGMTLSDFLTESEEEEGDGTEQAPPASSLLPPPAPAKEPSKAVAADAVVARPRRSAKRTAPVKKRSAPKPKPQPSLPAETGEGGEQSGTLPFTIRLEQHELQRLIGYAVAHGEESVAECARHLLLSSVAAEEMTPDALLARIRSDLASLEDAFAKGAGLDVPKIVRVIVSSE